MKATRPSIQHEKVAIATARQSEAPGSAAASDEPLDQLDLAWLLPPSVAVIPKLLELMRDPDVPSDEMVEVVRVDAGLTADVLRVCNSVAHGGIWPVETIAMAVNRIGLREVYRVVLQAVSSASFSRLAEIREVIRELWQHSLRTALAAQLIAHHSTWDSEVAFTAGLLHDIGKLALWKEFREEYRALIDTAIQTGQPLSELEEERFGLNHAAVGGRLLSEWNLPREIAYSVAFHHESHPNTDFGSLAAVITLANELAHTVEWKTEGAGKISAGPLHTLSVEREEVLQYRNEMESRLARLHFHVVGQSKSF